MPSFEPHNLDAAEISFLSAIHDRILAEAKPDGLAQQVSEVISKALVELYRAGQRDPEALQRYAAYKATTLIIGNQAR